MSKKTSRFVEQYQDLDNPSLIKKLADNPGDEGATIVLWERLQEMKGSKRKDRGANLAMAILMHGHDSCLIGVFKAVQCYAKQKCYAPADFETMAQAKPDHKQWLLDLMDRYCDGRRTIEDVRKKFISQAVAV